MEATDEPALLELADGREDGSSFEALVALLYEELHALAHRALARESPGHTLQTTALLHEAYLKLADQDRARWRDRNHFLAIASQALRRVLVDLSLIHI